MQTQTEGPAALVTRRRFTVDEYHRIAEAGIFHPEERLELIDGEIIEMSPIGVRHAAGVKRGNNWFAGRLGSRAIVSVQDPVRVSQWGEPQPDLMLIRYRPDFYATRPPAPEDVLLAIEVSDTTLAFDRETKLPRYAAAGIPETWIMNLVDDRIEAYREPREGIYHQVTLYSRGETLSPLAFPDLSVRVDELLP